MNKTQLKRVVERAKQGDMNAFAMLYSHLSNSAYYLAYKLVQNHDDAMDIMQDSMLKLYHSLDKISSADAVAAYTNKIVHSISINHLKARGHDVLVENSELVDLQYEESDDYLPEEYVNTKEKRLAVARLVDKLPDSQRVVIVLFYYEQLKITQIAETLEISENSVLARLHRARGALRRMVEKDDVKKGALYSMAVPILAKLLFEESESLFPDSGRLECWQELCRNLEVSAEVTEATSAIVSGAASTLPGSAVAVKALLTGKTLIVTGASAAVIIGGVLGFTLLSGGAEEPEPIPSESPPAITAVATEDGINIDISPIDADINPKEQICSDPPLGETDPVVENGATTPDTTTGTPPPQTTETEPTPSENTDTDVSPPPPSTAPIVSETDDKNPVLSYSNQEISVTLGETLTLVELTTKSGISVTDGAGNPLPYEIRFYESIDWQSEGIYVLQVYVPATESTADYLSFVAVHITA